MFHKIIAVLLLLLTVTQAALVAFKEIDKEFLTYGLAQKVNYRLWNHGEHDLTKITIVDDTFTNTTVFKVYGDEVLRLDTLPAHGYKVLTITVEPLGIYPYEDVAARIAYEEQGERKVSYSTGIGANNIISMDVHHARFGGYTYVWYIFAALVAANVLVPFYYFQNPSCVKA